MKNDVFIIGMLLGLMFGFVIAAYLILLFF